MKAHIHLFWKMIFGRQLVIAGSDGGFGTHVVVQRRARLATARAGR
jgi:hypothetical protein